MPRLQAILAHAVAYDTDGEELEEHTILLRQPA